MSKLDQVRLGSASRRLGGENIVEEKNINVNSAIAIVICSPSTAIIQQTQSRCMRSEMGMKEKVSFINRRCVTDWTTFTFDRTEMLHLIRRLSAAVAVVDLLYRCQTNGMRLFIDHVSMNNCVIEGGREKGMQEEEYNSLRRKTNPHTIEKRRRRR